MNRINHSSRFIEMFGGNKYPNVRLGEFTDLTWGDTNTTKNSYISDGYLAFSASGPDGKLDHFDYDREGIVLSAIGADCGKTWFAEGKWSCIKNTIRFWSISDKLDNHYLFLATRDKEYWPRKGGAQPFIPQGEARDCVIPLPPIDMQYAFVTFSNQADKSKFNGFKSRFIEMFGQVSDIAPRYEVKKLSDCCSYISDGSHFSPAEDSSGLYPMLSVKDMTEKGFVYSDCKYISKKDFDVLVSNGCQPHLNDVLVAKDGSYFKYSFVVTEDKEQAILSSIAILRPKTDIIDPRYLAYYMLTDAVIQLVEKNYLTGTAIRRVILKGFKEIPTIIPPMALQKSFVAVLEQADKSKYLN